jgi:hypothetical protein
MNCKICENEVYTEHAILVEDEIDGEEYYVCGLDCFMKWLANIGEQEEYKWSS